MRCVDGWRQGEGRVRDLSCDDYSRLGGVVGGNTDLQLRPLVDGNEGERVQTPGNVRVYAHFCEKAVKFRLIKATGHERRCGDGRMDQRGSILGTARQNGYERK